MTKLILVLVVAFISVSFIVNIPQNVPIPKTENYWLLLKRKSNTEILYYGTLGERNNSRVVRTFQVKSGKPSTSPTPLHSLLGKDYWLITKKEVSENPETAPHFLTLNIPFSNEPPFGPVSYSECDGNCDWQLPGSFGLHGVNGENERLRGEGSSGCVRHRDEDIKFLYNILTPEQEPIRYYIEDV